MKIRKHYRYDTDKYEYRFHFIDDGQFYGSVWENGQPSGYGPGRYNAGSIDNILFNDKNDMRYVVDKDSPWSFMRRLLSKGRTKFEP